MVTASASNAEPDPSIRAEHRHFFSYRISNHISCATCFEEYSEINAIIYCNHSLLTIESHAHEHQATQFDARHTHVPCGVAWLVLPTESHLSPHGSRGRQTRDANRSTGRFGPYRLRIGQIRRFGIRPGVSTSYPTPSEDARSRPCGVTGSMTPFQGVRSGSNPDRVIVVAIGFQGPRRQAPHRTLMRVLAGLLILGFRSEI